MVYIRAVLIVTSIVLIWATTVQASAVQANSSADQLPEAFYTLFAEWVDKYGLHNHFDLVHGQVEFVERALAILLHAAATLDVAHGPGFPRTHAALLACCFVAQASHGPQQADQ